MVALETLGKYEIRRVLGRGTMGVVYEGWDPGIERPVAIKTILLPESDDNEFRDEFNRFRREAQAAGRLVHPNIVTVYEYGESNHLAYIAMEYVGGPSLKSLLDNQGRLALPDILPIMQDLLDGLQYSHDRGVIHRDIKPANIMLTSDNRATARAKIADFGIARIESSSMTQPGMVMGTPAYMSPEQLTGQPVDQRTDIYSAGALLYQLLTGERPFEGGLSAIMHKVLHTDPPAPSLIAVTVPPAFDAVVRRAMAKRPDDRFASAAEFAGALAAANTPVAEMTMVAARMPELAERPTMVATPMAVGQPAAALAPSAEPGVAAAAAAISAASAAGVAAAVSAPPPTAASVTAASVAAPPRRSGTMVLIAAVAGVTLAAGASTSLLLRPQRAPPVGVASPAPAPAAAMPGTPQPQTLIQPLVAAPVPETPQAAAPTPAPPSSALPSLATGSPATPAQASLSPAPAPQEPAASASPAPTRPATVSPTALVAEPPRPVPVLTAAMARAGLEPILASQPCALVDGTVNAARDVSLNGFASSEAGAALRRQIANIPGVGSVQWTVTAADPRYCSVLEALQPIGPGAGAGEPRISLETVNGRTELHNGEQLRLRVGGLGFPAYIAVDYVASDGSVQHLYPQRADPRAHAAADPIVLRSPGQVLVLGDASPGQTTWAVGEPFGTDMIIAIAASRPLFTTPRPANAEKAETYIPDLVAAISRALAGGTRMSADVLSLAVLPK